MNTVEEVRKLLDKNRIKYDERDVDNTHVFDIDYFEECGDYLRHVFVTGECVSVETCYLALEQAIAATLPERTATAMVRYIGAIGGCTCSACDEYIDPWDKYCRHCGARITDMQSREGER